MPSFARQQQRQQQERAAPARTDLRVEPRPAMTLAPAGIGLAHDFGRIAVGSSVPLGLQTKLAIGTAGDASEREADRISEQITATPRLGGACKCGDVCPKCRREPEAARALRTTRSDDSARSRTDAPPVVHEALRSGSQPLGADDRAYFESRLGHDFSRVRVHTGEPAEASAKAVHANAYTVGRDIVFAAARYAPHTPEGRRLLAHELVHVVQQTGGEAQAEGGATQVQRDLATPEPDEPPPLQADLTEAQVRAALEYNRARYDQANTRLIQQILGGPVTGRWTSDNIVAIAETQGRYGLQKDGKVGPETFRFITQEQAAEGAGTATEDCLTMFQATPSTAVGRASPGPNGTTRIVGHHIVRARFSSRCDCSQFRYRQSIVGSAMVYHPDGTSQEFSRSLNLIPGGRLPGELSEDGNINCPGITYGNRAPPGQPTTTTTCGENQYVDDSGATNQASGCNYRGEDQPELKIEHLATGDEVDLQVRFKGEILRNDRPIAVREWTDIDHSLTTP